MNARAYARFELNYFNKKFNTKVAFKAVPKKKINALFAVVGRSVLGKTVPAASGRTQDLGHSFSQYGPPGRQITYIYVIFRREISCKVKLCTKTISVSHCESLEIRLFYRKLSSRKRGISSSVFHRNSLQYGND